MANQEKKPVTPQDPAGTHVWGQVLANCLWVVTLLMVLAFFVQSIGEMLAK
jgi:hypothetical protein